MKSPFTGGETTLEKQPRVLNYRKDTFEVLYHFYVCKDTQEQFTTAGIDTRKESGIKLAALPPIRRQAWYRACKGKARMGIGRDGESAPGRLTMRYPDNGVSAMIL